METKKFGIRTILTVTTGRLLTASEPAVEGKPQDNGIGKMYDLLGWMTDDQPFTHQLGRFAKECKPWLLRWFPELESLGSEDNLLRLGGLLEKKKHLEADEAIRFWLSAYDLPESYDVPKIPRDDHNRKDPIQEMVEMRSPESVIVVSTGDE